MSSAAVVIAALRVKQTVKLTYMDWNMQRLRT